MRNDINKVFQAFLKHYEIFEYLGSSLSLLTWDQEVVMPKRGGGPRATVCGAMAEVIHNRLNSVEFKAICDSLKSSLDSLTDTEQRMFRRFLHGAERSWKIPSELTNAIATQASLGQSIWAEARRSDNYGVFEPELDKIVDLKRREADIVGYADHPYDALIDEYEPGMTTTELDHLFQSVISRVQDIRYRLRAKVGTSINNTISLTANEQMEFVRALAPYLGFDFDSGRIDEGDHPATNFIHHNDVRIIARSEDGSIATGVFLTIHELGHAAYYNNIDSKYLNTPLFGGASTAFQEAIARFWENIICKSAQFWAGVEMHANQFPKTGFNRYSGSLIFTEINRVSDSPIRFKVDEMSYLLHIYIRFLIERDLISGSIRAKDIPDVWNGRMHELLGVKVNTNAEGCLQDVHWSCGLIGYFPTYFLGSLYGVHIYSSMKKALPRCTEDIEKLDFASILSWLRDNIFQHGAYYSAEELLLRLSVSETSLTEGYVGYLEEKEKTVTRVTS